MIEIADDKKIIWSNNDLNIAEWRADLQENYPDANESELCDIMYETNNSYLDDVRDDLNVQLTQPIIVIADIGRWNGRVSGYRIIESKNIKDCLFSEYDYTTWYVDKNGDFRCEAHHHDGTNHYLYRVFRENASDFARQMLTDGLYDGKAMQASIERYTRRLGDEIGKVYGWDFPLEAVTNCKRIKEYAR